MQNDMILEVVYDKCLFQAVLRHAENLILRNTDVNYLHSILNRIFAIRTTCFVYQGSRDTIFKSCARLEFQIWAEYFLFWGGEKPQIEFFGDGKKFRSE